MSCTRRCRGLGRLTRADGRRSRTAAYWGIVARVGEQGAPWPRPTFNGSWKLAATATSAFCLPGGDGQQSIYFRFTAAVIVGRIGEMVSYDDRWCYYDEQAAAEALKAWDGSKPTDRLAPPPRYRTPPRQERSVRSLRIAASTGVFPGAVRRFAQRPVVVLRIQVRWRRDAYSSANSAEDGNLSWRRN